MENHISGFIFTPKPDLTICINVGFEYGQNGSTDTQGHKEPQIKFHVEPCKIFSC